MKSFMRRRLLSLPLLLTLPAAATAQQSYEFAVFGDLPYVSTDVARAFYLPKYRSLLASIDSSSARFVVHVGDYTTGPFCGDSTVNLRHAEFQAMNKPFVFVFGDNDWTDCARGGFDPLERLAKLRQVFTQGNTALGKQPMWLVRQSESPQFRDYRENVRWRHGQELYIALNLPGSNNNWGRERRPSAEYVARNAANLAFLREGFELAMRDGMRGIAIFIQANPGLYATPDQRTELHTRGFDDFLRELEQLTVRFGRPVVLFHGDTHHFRVDMPLRDNHGHVIPNLTRVETFGHPNYYWIRVLVDPADPALFSFRLVRAP